MQYELFPTEGFSFFSLSSGSCGNSYYLGNTHYGILIDAGIGPRVIKKRLDAVLEIIDHQYLNDLPAFKTVNPSSENIARFIFEQLADVIREESQTRARLYSPSSTCS